jgi:hypothetical protein
VKRMGVTDAGSVFQAVLACHQVLKNILRAIFDSLLRWEMLKGLAHISPASLADNVRVLLLAPHLLSDTGSVVRLCST